MLPSPPRARVSPLDLAGAFAQIGLSSVGGAAAPLRHVLVVQRRWLDEHEFAEVIGVCQALPGATGGNMAVIVGDRFAGFPGVLASLGAMVLPTMGIAIALGALALRLAANPRIAAGEVAVAAAAAGIFIANGLRLASLSWSTAARSGEAAPWRWLRSATMAAAIVLVAALHVRVPLVVAGLAVVSVALERAAGASSARTPQA